MKILPHLPPAVILTKDYFHPLPLPIRRRRQESNAVIFLTQLRVVVTAFLLVTMIPLLFAVAGAFGAALGWLYFAM